MQYYILMQLNLDMALNLIIVNVMNFSECLMMKVALLLKII